MNNSQSTSVADGRRLLNSGQRSLLTDDDLFLFNEGTHQHLYDKLGRIRWRRAGSEELYFGVWAPNAEDVMVETYSPGKAGRPCGRAARPASGKVSFPKPAPACFTNTICDRGTGGTK